MYFQRVVIANCTLIVCPLCEKLIVAVTKRLNTHLIWQRQEHRAGNLINKVWIYSRASPPGPLLLWKSSVVKQQCSILDLNMRAIAVKMTYSKILVTMSVIYFDLKQFNNWVGTKFCCKAYSISINKHNDLKLTLTHSHSHCTLWWHCQYNIWIYAVIHKVSTGKYTWCWVSRSQTLYGPPV